MESITSGVNSGLAIHDDGAETVSSVETPALGKARAKRLVTTRKKGEQVVSVLIEEYEGDILVYRQIDQYLPVKQISRESFERDGSLISSETERSEKNQMLTRIVIRGNGKSATARIICGESEARATERLVMIETPKASYTFQPFDGRWTSYYKELNMRLELKANFLKNPDSTILGPDGIKLEFRKGRLVDVLFSEELSSDNDFPIL